MPTYTYLCKKCSHAMDVFHSMTAAPKVKCESCGSTRTSKQLGIGAGIIFKGSGFYETDYVKNSKPKSEKSEKSGDTAKKSEKSETKSSTKSESSGSTKSSSTKSD